VMTDAKNRGLAVPARLPSLDCLASVVTYPTTGDTSRTSEPRLAKLP